jgi:amino acid permease
VHQAKTLGEAWEKEFQTSPWLLSLALFLFCGGAALTYNIVMGDTFSCLAASLGMTGWLASRHASILFISITTLLPLCSLQSLAALAPMSMLGVIGVLVTTLFMGWRCLSPASPYRLAPSAAAAMAAVGAISQKQQQQQRLVRVAPTAASAFLSSLSPEFYPKFKTYSKIISPSALILTAMAATAFSGHFSAPDFYHSLKDGSNDDDDKFALRKYHRVTAISFFSVAVINICILAFGFLTFGGSSAGIILNNYSTLDKGASLCRFLMALCVIGGYPFLISACKNALLEVGDHFNKKKKKKINDKHGTFTSSLHITIVLCCVSQSSQMFCLWPVEQR